MENIQENNRLIAEFMGAEYKADDCGDMEYWLKDHIPGEWNLGFRVEALKYHKSWDWLMPVVQKIYTLADYRLSTPYQQLIRMWIHNPIELVYATVLSFIKHYQNETCHDVKL